MAREKAIASTRYFPVIPAPKNGQTGLAGSVATFMMKTRKGERECVRGRVGSVSLGVVSRFSPEEGRKMTRSGGGILHRYRPGKSIMSLHYRAPFPPFLLTAAISFLPRSPSVIWCRIIRVRYWCGMMLSAFGRGVVGSHRVPPLCSRSDVPSNVPSPSLSQIDSPAPYGTGRRHA